MKTTTKYRFKEVLLSVCPTKIRFFVVVVLIGGDMLLQVGSYLEGDPLSLLIKSLWYILMLLDVWNTISDLENRLRAKEKKVFFLKTIKRLIQTRSGNCDCGAVTVGLITDAPEFFKAFHSV